MANEPLNSNELEGLRDSIRDVAVAASDGSRDEVDRALRSFMELAFPVLAPFVRSVLRERRSGGPDGLIAEAEDVLQDLLFKLTRVACQCEASDDDKALSWLMQVAKNEARDAAKSSTRRFALLSRRLALFLPGYAGRATDPERDHRGFLERSATLK